MTVSKKTHGDRQTVRIAILGGGGRYWCPVVLRDLALCPHLTGEVRLYDLSRARLIANAREGRELFQHPDSRTEFSIRTTTKLQHALKGADFVFIGIAPGPAAMFGNDLEIPAKYGIFHTVGDTTGPAGISRALRAVPIHTRFAEAVAEHCPEAWVVNYTNPMTICTAALYAAFPGIKAFGCCHEVAAAKRHLAGVVEQTFATRRPDPGDILMEIAGVNHFTFATAASFHGHDLFGVLRDRLGDADSFADQTDYARKNAASGAFWDHKGLIALDFFRRFGALGAAGDRHLAEFVPWYLAAGETSLHRWGVVLTPAAFRRGAWKPAPGVKPAPNPLDLGTSLPRKLHPSGEEGVQQVCALCGIQDLDTNVNLPNHGQLAQLPSGAVVETNARFRRNALHPVVPHALPAALAPLVQRIADVQALTLHAARTCAFDTALQALLLDPLCHLDTDRAAAMLREMIRANRAMLPGWSWSCDTL